MSNREIYDETLNFAVDFIAAIVKSIINSNIQAVLACMNFIIGKGQQPKST